MSVDFELCLIKTAHNCRQFDGHNKCRGHRFFLTSRHRVLLILEVVVSIFFYHNMNSKVHEKDQLNTVHLLPSTIRKRR